MLDLLLLFAEEEAPKGPGLEPLFIMLALFGLFYFLVLRPMSRRQEKERRDLVADIQKNDKVITIAGIYGTVVSVSDKEDEVVVKVDDNCRLKMTKMSIHKNMSREERLKALKEQKDQKKEGAA